jgi:hypothetical protein
MIEYQQQRAPQDETKNKQVAWVEDDTEVEQR